MTQTVFVPNSDSQVKPAGAGDAFSHVATGLHEYPVSTSTMTFALMMRQMVLKLVAEVHNPQVNHTNYALSVLQAFIVISLLPLQVSAGGLAKEIQANSSFQQTMSQFQSFFTYIESLSSTSGNGLPPGWNNSAVSSTKLNQLYSQFYNFFYASNATAGASGVSGPTWNDLFFEVRDPTSPTGYVKVPLIIPGSTPPQFQPSIAKILTAFSAYFGEAEGDSVPPILPSNANGINPNSHVPGVVLLLFADMQWKFDQSKNFVPKDAAGDYDFAAAYGIENKDGSITGSSFGLANSSIAAANSFWVQLQAYVPGLNGQGGYLGADLYSAANEAINRPSSHNSRDYFETVDLPFVALTYAQAKVSGPSATGGILGLLCDSTGTAQQEADKEGQDQITALQTLGQTMATQVQTATSIASNEALSEAQMVAGQTPA
ncbi:MAG: hypothetical protein KBC64_01985 [Simkaniaceae bacterium]|nr:hypothetical protein [Simkaniaceae bacterium]